MTLTIFSLFFIYIPIQSQISIKQNKKIHYKISLIRLTQMKSKEAYQSAGIPHNCIQFKLTLYRSIPNLFKLLKQHIGVGGSSSSNNCSIVSIKYNILQQGFSFNFFPWCLIILNIQLFPPPLLYTVLNILVNFHISFS